MLGVISSTEVEKPSEEVCPPNSSVKKVAQEEISGKTDPLVQVEEQGVGVVQLL